MNNRARKHSHNLLRNINSRYLKPYNRGKAIAYMKVIKAAKKVHFCPIFKKVHFSPKYK